MNSIVSYPERGEGGNNSYRGNFSPHLVEDLLEQFKPKWVVDPMAGGGTTKDVCEQKGVHVWTADLHAGFDILKDEIAVGGDLGILHPPYYNMIRYSDDPRDLSTINDYGEFLTKLNEAQMRLFESLRQGGFMAVVIGDMKKKGILYPIQKDMRWYGKPVNVVIKAQHNTTSGRGFYSGNFIPIVHEYVVITKKPEVWIVALRDTRSQERSMIDNPSMTWRAIVQSGLEFNGGTASLETLYNSIEQHARAKNDNTWQEQIRRTLQTYPNSFENVSKGTWRLIQ